MKAARGNARLDSAIQKWLGEETSPRAAFEAKKATPARQPRPIYLQIGNSHSRPGANIVHLVIHEQVAVAEDLGEARSERILEFACDF